MLNGNSGSKIVPHPKPSVPHIQGVQGKGQVGVVVEEPIEVVALVLPNSRALGFLCTHPSMSGIQRCITQGLDEQAR